MTTTTFFETTRIARARRRTGFLSVLATVTMTASLAMPAGAASAYTSRVAPLPSNSFAHPQANLLGVSCPSTGNCVAVGRYQANSGPTGVIETESHGTWLAPIIVKLPADADASPNTALNAVKCVSIGNCVAVGQYKATTSYEGLIVTESSGVWGTGVKAPLPSDAITSTVTSLYGIDCVNTTTCVAVGQYQNAIRDQALIIRKSNGVWGGALRARLPKYAKPNFITQLDGVSCTSAGNCVAVGQFVDTSPARRAMIDTEVNGTWTSSVVAPLPTNADRNPWAGLFGVRCFSGGNCVAVGVYQGPYGGQGLIDTETGGVWSSTRQAPLPAGQAVSSHAAQLLSVSCVSFTHCVAVGEDLAGINDFGVAATGTNGSWSSVVTPRPSDASTPSYGILNAISCTTATSCVGVGQYASSTGQPALITTR